MRNLNLILLTIILSFNVGAQTKDLNLKNGLIIGQLDRSEDRYSVEIALTEILSENGVKAIPSLNVLKVGADVYHLENDSILNIVHAKGIDTYVTISVRGYDKRYKLAKNHSNFKTAIRESHLFPLYKEEMLSISFEVTFYRNGEFVATDMIRCGNIDSRDDVVKQLKKKLRKRVQKWM